MKRNFIKLTGIAVLSTLALTACKPDKVESEPLLGLILSNSIRSSAVGNCAISINNTGLYTGAAIALAVTGNADAAVGSNAFRTHYNAINNLNVTTISAEPYNKKYDAFFTLSATWTEAVRANYLSTLVAAGEAGTLGTTTQNQLNGLKAIRGTGLLACTRIPRAQCSLAGTTTADQATDIANARNVYNTLLSNSDCFMNNSIRGTLRTNIFRGLDSATAISLIDQSAAYNNPLANADTNSIGSTQQILGAGMYPKFGTLVSLGFASLMPMITGTTAHSVTSTTLTRGSNINFTVIDSCETVGLPNVGPVATGTTLLTTTVEVSYALSTGGIAASQYAAARGLTSYSASTVESAEADTCNNSFRDKFSIAVALGGGKLPKVTGISGDGGKSTLLTACTYGGTAATRATANATLAASSTVLTGLAECPAQAWSAAAKFGDEGLQNLTFFPSN